MATLGSLRVSEFKTETSEVLQWKVEFKLKGFVCGSRSRSKKFLMQE